MQGRSGPADERGEGTQGGSACAQQGGDRIQAGLGRAGAAQVAVAIDRLEQGAGSVEQ